MFLLSQILVFLALALIIGGLIGYAFRACLADNVHDDLRDALAAEQSRTQGLFEQQSAHEVRHNVGTPVSLTPFPASDLRASQTIEGLHTLSARDLEHALLAAAPGKSPKTRFGRDDLTAIKGLTPQMDAFLASLGITRLADIAELTSSELYWLIDHLPGDGASIYRDHWVAQAKALM